MKYADELINEYTTDLKPIKALYSYYRDHRNICLILFKECEEAQEWELSVEFRNDYQYYKARAKELGSIISSSEYSIQWLRDAKEPGNRREIGRRSRYQRTELWSDIDKSMMINFRNNFQGMSKENSKRLDECLEILSNREKEAIISIVGKSNSYKETAEYLGVSRSSIQSYIDRGMDKINNMLENGTQISLL